MIVYAPNGEPLTKHRGAPLRLLAADWYGAANVKWPSRIHVWRESFLGKYQSRWYRTMREEKIDGETVWNETAVTHMRLKSVVARVTKEGIQHKVVGFVLNDGTPLRSVEVEIVSGSWQPATLAPAAGRFAWKLFSYTWEGATPSEHTVVSSATDRDGYVRSEQLADKKTFLRTTHTSRAR